MKETSYRFTRLAAADLDHIWNSTSSDSPEAADRLVLEINKQIGLLSRFPGVGHRRKDLADQRPLLFSPIGNYMIAYKVQRQGLLVVRILHAARNIGAILRNKQ